MDKIFYQTQVENLLFNDEYYQKIDYNPQKEIMKKYRTFLKDHQTELTKKEYDYLTNFEHKTSNFFGLPKTHKNKEINEASAKSISNYTELPPSSDLIFRPIVAGPVCETHRLSNFIDILLQPYTKYIKSYVKDTNSYRQKISQDSILVSFDVESLYSNIPHDLGLEAIAFWINKYPGECPSRISNEFVLEGIKIILENNSFHFNDAYFIQTKGTAMGSKFVSIYATLKDIWMIASSFSPNQKNSCRNFIIY